MVRNSAREKQRTRMRGCTGEQLDQCPLRVLLNSIESIQVLLMQDRADSFVELSAHYGLPSVFQERERVLFYLSWL